MGDKTSILRIWSHARQIAPLSADPAKTAWFSVNLTPVFVADPAGVKNVDDVKAQYLKPWNWKWSTMKVALIANGVVQSTKNIPAAHVHREGGIPALNTELDTEFKDASSGFAESSPSQSADMDDSGAGRNWKLWLMHASTYPGDLGMQMGLAVWFEISYPDLKGIDEIVAAPIFDSVPFSGTYAPGDAGAITRLKPSLDAPPEAGDKFWVTRWSYPAQPAGSPDLAAEWIQPRLQVKIPVTPTWDWGMRGLFNEATYWATPQPGWAQGLDTHEKLEQRLASVFDLPMRLLEYADRAVLGCKPTTVDSDLGIALVSALRDLLQNVGKRPDGGDLIGDVAAVLTKDVATRVSLRTTIQNQYGRYAKYTDWQARLTGALAASLKNDVRFAGSWEMQTKTETSNDWLKRLHAAQTWALDPANLRVFIEQDWSNAAQNDATLGPLWGSGGANVDKYLADLDLATVARLGFLGNAWAAQTGDWYSTAKLQDGTTKLANSVTTALKNVYHERLGLSATPVMGYDTLAPVINKVTGGQQPDVEAYLDDFVKRWSTSADGPAPDTSSVNATDYSQGNHGLNIQFATPATASDKNTDEQEFLHTLRGAAIAMRAIGAGGAPVTDWSLLNLGQYSVRGELDLSKQQAPAYDAARVAVVPVQTSYRNGLLQVSSTYRNQPLGSRSPAAALSRVRKFKGASQGGEDYDTRPHALFELWNAYRDPAAGSFRLPRLCFAAGQTYEVAVAAVGLAGELPAEIADPQSPWVAKPGFTPPASAVQKGLTYLRTVPVGLVRVEGQNRMTPSQPVSKMSGPTIPENVFPIARSKQLTADQKDTLILLCDKKNESFWTDEASESVSFWIRPPATDFDTFDACFAGIDTAADRGKLRAYLAARRDVTNDQGAAGGTINLAGDNRLDLTLDDPFVTGYKVTMTQVYPQAGTGPTTSFDVNRGVPANGDALKLLTEYQSGSVRTDFVVGPANATKPVNAANALIISVPKGSVYRVDIAPDFAANSALFPAKLQRAGLRTFYVEVAAAPDVSAETALAFRNALTLAPTLPPAIPADLSKPDPLTVSLDLGVLGSVADPFHRVELMAQRWRWQGRPLARKIGVDANGADRIGFDFPWDSLPAGTNVDAVLEPIDGIYFGERDSSDQLVVPGQFDSLAQGQDPKPELYRYDLTNAPQALYYRFAIRAYSRYEGLLRRGASVDSRTPTPDSDPEKWRRVLPLCRRDRPAPKPIVRLIIPLTQTPANATTPGLMVVLDDMWYEWGGLAEQFEVAIDTVTPPDDAAGAAVQEIGPDPIWARTDIAAPFKVNESEMSPIGPVGFTFDINTNAPLFGRTSFVIPAPTQATNGTQTVKDLSWWFVKLKFQRSLKASATVSPAGKPIDDHLAAGRAIAAGLASGFTDPIQAQFLPPSNLWDITWPNAGAGKLYMDDLHAEFGGSISIRDSDENALTVNPLVNPFVPKNPGRSRNEVWALLTREIDDAFGRLNQEAFVDLVPFAALNPYTLPPGQNAPNIVRLVEVQCLAEFSTPKTKWQDLAMDLFPAPPAKDVLRRRAAGEDKTKVDPAMARARIVRVSPPIRGDV